MKMCSVENCDNISVCKGYCSKHYWQWLHFGEIRKRTKNDPNEIVIENNICKIKLYNNKCIEIAEAIFDLKYLSEISPKYKWHLTKDGYVETSWYDIVGQHKGYLHQLVIQLSGQTIKEDQEIDHKNGNGLNCLEDNLRICTPSQNQHNRRIQKNNTSGFKGVSWNTKYQKWTASITVNNISIFLGNFIIKEDAARAYNTAAIKYHGEFAVLNVIN